MSMTGANVAQILTQEVEVPKPTPRRYKARMATKVKWAIGDAMELSVTAQDRLKKIRNWFEEARTVADASNDLHFLALIGKVEHEFWALESSVAEIERKLTTAIAESKPEKPKSKYSEL